MAVIRKEAYFPSNDGVSNIRTLIWADDTAAPIGVVQIAHGVAEHIGRYDEFARFLAENGFAVCGNDHIAHGKSAADADFLGICDEGDHVNMVKDMNALYNIMSARYNGLPYFLFGHSMGSLLARIYTGAFGNQLAGAIFCGTGQVPAPLVALADPVKNIMSMLPPAPASAGRGVDALLNFLSKKYFKEGDELSWLSRSRENVANYRADPFCGFESSEELTKELVTMAVKVSRPDWASKLPAGLPVMLISGGKDPCGLFGRGVINVADELAKVGIDPEVIIYPGDRHEILNEDDREKVYADVKAFLMRVVNG